MSEIPIINKSYEAYKGTVDINNHLEKRFRYSLGLGLETSLLNLIEMLVMGKHAPKTLKASYLLKAMAHLEVARLKLRLFLELSLANETKLFQIQAMLEESGRMLGGWIKSLEK
jgi:hypothetical protein